MHAQFKIKKDWEYDPTDNCFAIHRLYIGLHYELPFNTKKYWAQYTSNGDFTNNTTGPLGLHAEYAIHPKIGITANYSFTNSQVQWGQTELDSNTMHFISYNKGFTYQAHTIGIGAQNHIFYNKKIDVFIGAETGYTFYKYTIFTTHPYNSNTDLLPAPAPIHYMVYFGFRAFITPKIAANTNLGFGDISNVRIGFIYRFGY
jgi:hypothetical protein